MSIVSNIVDGIVKNVTAVGVRQSVDGLRYFEQAIKILEWAVKNGNTEALIDVVSVLTEWCNEAFDEVGNATPQLVSLLQGKSVDPFAVSRKKEQDLWAKWAGPAGIVHVISAPTTKSAPAVAASVPPMPIIQPSTTVSYVFPPATGTLPGSAPATTLSCDPFNSVQIISVETNPVLGVVDDNMGFPNE